MVLAEGRPGAPALVVPLLCGLAVLIDPVFLPQWNLHLFAIGLVAGAFEEIGWTGFATPRLLGRMAIQSAGLMLGFTWACWHALADYTGNIATMGALWPLWFAVFWLATLPPYRLLMTWLYARTSSGVTTDVCMVSPAISALEEGYNVQVVCDACGSSNPIAEEMSWRRMERAGVRLTSTNAIVAELVKNWASPAGAVAFPLLTSG